MGFDKALSGLTASSKQLEVISNNISNANTVGFKSSTTEFADVFATSVNSARSGNVSGGTTVNVKTVFSQGNISTTNNSLDFAIDGTGFFRVEGKNGVGYTRNGQFSLDKDGYLMSMSGDQVTGYAADASGRIARGVPSPILLNAAEASPVPTSEVTAKLNLDTSAAVATSTFSKADTDSYQYSTTIPAYDAQGDSHKVSLYFANRGGQSWDVYATADGTDIGTGPVSTITFDSNGRVTSGGKLDLSVQLGLTASTIAVDLEGSTLTSGSSALMSMDQNGLATGKLAGYSVAPDGVVTGRYSNGATRTLAQIALVDFANPSGMLQSGSNRWTATVASGEPRLGAPGEGVFGKIQSGALEGSNVDLSAELVKLLEAQRAYQANAQGIKALDELMQTANNM